MQGTCGRADAAMFDDGNQDLQLLEFHADRMTVKRDWGTTGPLGVFPWGARTPAIVALDANPM
ncbi:hypothetical protein CATMQ487_40820 [Sphaerotilus microaerophilus]|uniref:Uncharacterized protein n=1 Tax=Sphaerotilus microaerophilus TaxID=2914710 RepID=A0ABM7YR93_9BURK|nr:hypothetical protein CATMQ487_40820 [Sphaerotilus sp. FB-5]